MTQVLLWVGVVWGVLLSVVRFIESVYELSQTPEVKGVIANLIQIWKNFWPLNIEKYRF